MPGSGRLHELLTLRRFQQGEQFVASECGAVRGEPVIEGLRGEDLSGLPWSDAARRLRERVAFLRLRDAGLQGWTGLAIALWCLYSLLGGLVFGAGRSRA